MSLLYNVAWLLSLLLLADVVKSQSRFQCPMLGKTPPKHSETHNYVIDTFSDQGKFPFAIGRCTAISVISNNKWYKYVCSKQVNGTSSVWSVLKQEYTDSSCSGTGNVVATFMQNNTDGLPNFECNGAYSYAKFQLSVGTCGGGGATVYAGLNGCTPASKQLNFEIYCNASVAFIEFFYRGAGMMSTTNLPETTNLPGTTNLPMSTTDLSNTELNMTSTFLNISNTFLNISLNNTELFSTTELTPTQLLTSLFSTSDLEPEPSSSYVETSTSYLETTSVSAELCNSDDYCEVWIVPAGKCTIANTTILRNLQLYGQLLSCNTNLTQGGTSPPKKSASRVQLAIAAISSLFLAVALL